MLCSPRLRPSWLISYAGNTVVEINRNVMTRALDSKTNQVVRSDWGLTRGVCMARTCCRSCRTRQLGGNKGLGLCSADPRGLRLSEPPIGTGATATFSRDAVHQCTAHYWVFLWSLWVFLSIWGTLGSHSEVFSCNKQVWFSSLSCWGNVSVVLSAHIPWG